MVARGEQVAMTRCRDSGDRRRSQLQQAVVVGYETGWSNVGCCRRGGG